MVIIEKYLQPFMEFTKMAGHKMILCLLLDNVKCAVETFIDIIPHYMFGIFFKQNKLKILI